MSELLRGIITIKEMSVEDKRIKINDESGKVYSIWKTKQDGTPTVAYSTFEPMFMSAQGQSFEIGYDEKPNPKSQGTFFRAIKTIKKVEGVDKAYMDKKVSPDGKPATISTDLEMRLYNIENRLSALEGSSSTPQAPKDAETPVKTSDLVPPDGKPLEAQVKVEDIPF